MWDDTEKPLSWAQKFFHTFVGMFFAVLLGPGLFVRNATYKYGIYETFGDYVLDPINRLHLIISSFILVYISVGIIWIWIAKNPRKAFLFLYWPLGLMMIIAYVVENLIGVRVLL